MPLLSALVTIRLAAKDKLKNVDLSWADLKAIPDELFDLAHIERLSLWGNKLPELPERLLELPRLHVVELGSMEAPPKSIPERINFDLDIDLLEHFLKLAGPERIVGITLKDDAGRIPPQLFDLPNLTSLTVWRTLRDEDVLRKLPRLRSLTRLSLSQPFAPAVLELQALKYLALDISEDCPNLIAGLPNLRQLSLQAREPKKVAPPWLWAPNQLESLNLSNILLGDLPSGVFENSPIEGLGIFDADLTAVPKELSRLRHLRDLNLSGNKIRELPDFLFSLSDLESLWLVDCDLRDIPSSIGSLTKLQALSFHHNELEELPQTMERLVELRHLAIGCNRFRVVPSVVFKLSKLLALDVSNPSYAEREGTLREIPADILALQDLVDFGADNQPIAKPPAEIVAKGLAAIQDYYRQLDTAGVDYLCEAKLIVIGEPGAGKTTLTRKLRDSGYVLDSREPSTKGIDVEDWVYATHIDVPASTGRRTVARDFRVHLWDFGGQEIYHATHQFFLTRRSLYALVADSRREDTDFNYWMNAVELLSDNSPLVVVQNEKQDRRRELDESRLRGRFTNLQTVMRTNLATNRGLPELVRALRHALEALPHIGTPLPKTWKKVRETLEADGRDYISLDEFLDICAGAGFDRLEDKLQLSGFLHDLGICLHFQDDPLLKRTVILKPSWGTSAVYQVLDDPGVLERYGRFDRGHLKVIWSDPKYAEARDELLGLMMKFQLCYEIPGTGSFISPQLLQPAQPDYQWNSNDNLTLKYDYEFMPKGILTRFIVATHGLIHDHRWVWKSGVVLAKDGAMGEVVEDYPHRIVTLRVSGANRKELLTIIDWELERIHRSFPRLKYARLIPCNCDTCRNSAVPQFHRYDVVQKFALDGQSAIQCPRSYSMVDVRALIDNVFVQRATSVEQAAARTASAAPRTGPIKEVFVSYAWEPESERIVDELAMSLQTRGIKLIRDKNELRYKDPIREFMQRIGVGKCVAVVVSKEYLQSHNCMFELTEIAAHGNFANRVFPIILDDSAIFDVGARVDYIKYWEGRKHDLNDKMKSVSQEYLEGIREEIDLYARIRQTIAQLMDILANMNTLTAASLRRTRFEDLYAKLDARLSE